MKRQERSLDELWSRIGLGRADEEERVAAASLSGKNKDHRFVPNLLRLLEDSAEQVRYYALQSLVLRLKCKDDVMKDHCWRILREDSDEEVRGMAATCLGSIYFGSRSSSIFDQLLRELKDPCQPLGAKDALYTSLFEIAGRPPSEWPGLQSPWKGFKESDIDWSKVAWLEDQMENP